MLNIAIERAGSNDGVPVFSFKNTVAAIDPPNRATVEVYHCARLCYYPEFMASGRQAGDEKRFEFCNVDQPLERSI
jgi:hypothetical protein